MSLPQDLLELAWLLAKNNPQCPQDASLRRAVSTAYYALFHLLTDEASRFLISSGPDWDPLRNLVARGFDHSEMSGIAKAFSSGYGALPQHIQGVIPEAPGYPKELSKVADAFYDLQTCRHLADYDRFYRLTREETFTLVRRAESAFADWQKIRTHKAARTFLVALLMDKKWKRR
ncbi:MAG: hypothetical protein LGR52_02220 [Candidatus Thiosymbion ectosymbiont of Robbea hypermnestra]|nr:hypothetical protein [Candidatus Thiosymbion ectosymbiont of Robbea hypermnestra]